jgi:hypothetical protein
VARAAARGRQLLRLPEAVRRRPLQRGDARPGAPPGWTPGGRRPPRELRAAGGWIRARSRRAPGRGSERVRGVRARHRLQRGPWTPDGGSPLRGAPRRLGGLAPPRAAGVPGTAPRGLLQQAPRRGVRLAGAVGQRPTLERPRRRALRPPALRPRGDPLRESRRAAAHLAVARRGLGPSRSPACRSRSRSARLSRALARASGPGGRPARAAGVPSCPSHAGRGGPGHVGRDGAGRRRRLHRPLTGPRLGTRLYGLRQRAGGARSRNCLGRPAGGCRTGAGAAPRAPSAHSARHRDRAGALARDRSRRHGNGRVRRRRRVRGAHPRRPRLAGRARWDRSVRGRSAGGGPAGVGRPPRSRRRPWAAARPRRVAGRAFRGRRAGRSPLGLRPRRPEAERWGCLGGRPPHETAGERSGGRGPDSNRGHGAARSDGPPADRRRPAHPRHRELRRRIGGRAGYGIDGLPHRLWRAAQLAGARRQPARAVGVLRAPVRATSGRSA